ncbi:UNVERIFIED_ORG: hypothetical protein FNL38_102402 [Nocardia globerula]|uniref:Uncharacterized protein n=1 Tax=Nocardia globerula TaxID=1818 RepID=A0A652YT21_NOCGL|nr:hypothetical protein C8E04_4591 [Rhodococcus globerulus]
MTLHPDFASALSWRSCTAPVHIFSAGTSADRMAGKAMNHKHISHKRGVPRE